MAQFAMIQPSLCHSLDQSTERIFTYTNSSDFYANVEHLTVRFGISVIPAENFVSACEACLWHILKTVFLVILASCQTEES